MQTIETLSVKLVGDVTDFTSKMSGAMGAIQSVGDKMQAVGDRMQAIGQKWSIFITAPIVAFGKSALDSAADFEQSMNVTQQITSSTAEEMKAMSDQALQLGKDSVFSAGEVANAQLTLAKAGMDTNDIMASSAGVIALAAAADMELADAAKVSSDALNAFNLPASDAGKIADLLAAAANNSTASVRDMGKALQMSSAVMSQYGFTAEETVTILAQMANAGIRNSDAGTSLKVAMMKLAAPTENAAKELSKFGVSVYDSSGAMRNSREIILDFIKNLTVGAEQTHISAGADEEMTKAAKKASAAVGPLTNKIEEQQMKLSILNQEMAGIVEKYGEGSTQAQNKQLAILKLTNALEENQAKYDAASAAISTYTAEEAAATNYTYQVTEAMRNHALATIFGTDAVRTMNVEMAQGVKGYDEMYAAVTETGLAQEVADARMKGLAGAIEYFKGTLDSMMIDTALPWLNTLSEIIRNTADWIAKFGELDPALQRNIVIFAALAAAIGPVLIYSGLLISAVGSMVSAFAGFTAFLLANPIIALAALAAALVAFAIAWENDWGGIRDKTTAAVGYVQTKFWEMVAYVRDSLPVWRGMLEQWGIAAGAWIVEMAPVALAKLGEWTGALLRWVADKLPDWIAALVNWATALVTWIGDSLPGAIRGIGEWVRSFVGWGNTEGKSQLMDMAGNFVRVLSDWVVNDLVPKVWPAMRKFGVALYDALVEIIRSLRDAAVNIGIGIVQGIIDGINGVWQRLYDAARHAASGALDSAKQALGISSPSKEGLKIGQNFGESMGTGIRAAVGNLSLDVTAGLRGALTDTDLHYATVGAGGRGGGMPAIVLNQYFSGNPDRAAVASGSREGVLAGLRQVGLS